MKTLLRTGLMVILSVGVAGAAEPAKVNALNFARAETDMYLTRLVKQAGGLAKFHHERAPAQIDKQDVVRMNRDTLYSSAVFDLDAGPVTITLPDSGKRFMSLQLVTQDHYAETFYAPVRKTFTRADVGTRYFAVLARTFMDPANPADIKAANSVQDAMRIEQAGAGRFEVPAWDPITHEKARDALLALSALGGTKDNRFGKKSDVDTISWLLGTAAGWGGNPLKDAMYLPGYPPNADGKTAYEVTIRDVPVDGFWSFTVYDAKGFMFENPQRAYSVNNVTAKKGADGAYHIRFGGDPKGADNYLAIAPGWNYVLRLYRPRQEILNGTWKAPQLKPIP